MPRTSDRLLLTAGLAGLVAPLVAARLLWTPPADGPVSWECPLLHATGVPCPACGATRAFVHFMHGDEGFLHYNWAWLLIWAALLAWITLVIVRSARGVPLAGPWVRRVGAFLQPRPAATVAFPFALLALPWLVAVGNLAWISAY